MSNQSILSMDFVAVYADDSDAAQRATETGLRLAAATAARCAVWTVQSPSMPQRQDSVGMTRPEARQLADALGISTSNEILSGEDSAEALLHEADRQKPSLLVLGDHSSSRIQRLFGRSTSAVLLRKSTIPMLLVNANSPYPENGHMGSMLVAVDFSSGSLRALQSAAEYAALAGTRIYPVHVDSTPRPPRVSRAEIETYDRKQLIRLQQFCAPIAEVSPGHCQVVRSAAVAKAIDSSAQKLGVDVVVIGTLGQSGLGRLLLGSTAEALTQISQLPVLVIPTRH